MKSKLIWLIFALILIGIIFSVVNNKKIENGEFKPLEINVGDEFSYIDYDNKMYVLNYIMSDVTGDEKKDMIIVIGEKNSVDDINAMNMDIVVYEPEEERFYNLKLKKFNGEMPRLEVCELNGDGIQDIVLRASDENGNVVMRIASWNNGEFEEIFKARDNKGIVFAGEFMDGFKVYLKCSKYKKELNMDLQDRKENYVTNGFFDESGRLLKTDAKVSTSGFCSVEFVQLDGYSGIQTMQRVIGFNNDDLLDELTVIWKYENGKWCVKEAKGNNVGNLLY